MAKEQLNQAKHSVATDQSEVGDDAAAVVLDEDVLRLDVSVGDRGFALK